MMSPYVLAAVVSSIGYGTASVLEAMATRKASGTKIYRHPLYLTGLGFDALAWFSSVIALQHLTIFTVQAIVASSLLVTVLLARWAFSTHLSAKTLGVMGLMAIALVFLALSTGAQRPADMPVALVMVLVGALVVVGFGLAVGHRRFSPMIISVLAGLAAGVAALAGRGLQVPAQWWLLIGSPMLWVIAASGALAMIGYTRALELGSVGEVTAIFTVIEVVIPGVIGMLVYGDAARDGWEITKFISLAVAIGAVMWLAGQPGAVPEQQVTTSHPSVGKQERA